MVLQVLGCVMQATYSKDHLMDLILADCAFSSNLAINGVCGFCLRLLNQNPSSQSGLTHPLVAVKEEALYSLGIHGQLLSIHLSLPFQANDCW
jgi:hypothetical protein